MADDGRRVRREAVVACAHVEQRHPEIRRRPAQPQEAAKPVLFLCSALSNYVHGQVLNVTGGQFGGMTT